MMRKLHFSLFCLLVSFCRCEESVFEEFRTSKISNLYAMPLVVPRFDLDYDEVGPVIDPSSGDKVLNIISGKDLDVIRNSVLQKKLYKKEPTKKKEKYEVLFLFENRKFLRGVITLEDNVAWLKFYRRFEGEDTLRDIALSSDVYKILLRDSVQIPKGDQK